MDLSERREEFSQYGSQGKKASVKKSKGLSHRPKKSQPRYASESSSSVEESSSESSASSHTETESEEEDEDGTFAYQFE